MDKMVDWCYDAVCWSHTPGKLITSDSNVVTIEKDIVWRNHTIVPKIHRSSHHGTRSTMGHDPSRKVETLRITFKFQSYGRHKRLPHHCYIKKRNKKNHTKKYKSTDTKTEKKLRHTCHCHHTTVVSVPTTPSTHATSSLPGFCKSCTEIDNT